MIMSIIQHKVEVSNVSSSIIVPVIYGYKMNQIHIAAQTIFKRFWPSPNLKKQKNHKNMRQILRLLIVIFQRKSMSSFTHFKNRWVGLEDWYPMAAH